MELEHESILIETNLSPYMRPGFDKINKGVETVATKFLLNIQSACSQPDCWPAAATPVDPVDNLWLEMYCSFAAGLGGCAILNESHDDIKAEVEALFDEHVVNPLEDL